MNYRKESSKWMIRVYVLHMRRHTLYRSNTMCLIGEETKTSSWCLLARREILSSWWYFSNHTTAHWLWNEWSQWELCWTTIPAGIDRCQGGKCHLWSQYSGTERKDSATNRTARARGRSAIDAPWDHGEIQECLSTRFVSLWPFRDIFDSEQWKW